MIPLLLVHPDGRILGTNDGARDLLGNCVGRLCWDVVGALKKGRHQECVPGCVGDLHDEDGHQRDRDTRVRGDGYRLVCSAVGDRTVVLLLPPMVPDPPEQPLSPREREVLGLVKEGHSARGIAERLDIGVETVRTHVVHARKKLGARTRAEAVARALETGEIA
ncbi:MAG: helix-turn-helix transcriptional regulator [Deltaproteobacteria bacterium]|nr:helix-turn-helix transcriptional regulator [Deltaproteobacteria bacterium]MBW2256574.1 helix-turn-helix transcriptional regulator [Deltaproteobacteria bacterium]